MDTARGELGVGVDMEAGSLARERAAEDDDHVDAALAAFLVATRARLEAQEGGGARAGVELARASDVVAVREEWASAVAALGREVARGEDDHTAAHGAVASGVRSALPSALAARVRGPAKAPHVRALMSLEEGARRCLTAALSRGTDSEEQDEASALREGLRAAAACMAAPTPNDARAERLREDLRRAHAAWERERAALLSENESARERAERAEDALAAERAARAALAEEAGRLTLERERADAAERRAVGLEAALRVAGARAGAGAEGGPGGDLVAALQRENKKLLRDKERLEAFVVRALCAAQRQAHARAQEPP